MSILAKSQAAEIQIGPAALEDVPRVIEIDAKITGEAKAEFWYSFFSGQGSNPKRSFLVARDEGRVVGYIIGTVRAWEFGSPPSGWIHAVGVDPTARKAGVGTKLFNEMVEFLRGAGANTIRTMLHIDDHLLMSFFRTHGMAAGPFVELEMSAEQT
ncbi:GNAT family N-acetyltransferase [Propylenella binzhouense]|uniref:GNAT family N-acetyltransferase n=1 Tax=Propylenella binzhouense TaxID=2555902 RepID=UPI001370EFCF|nr:GNAT family N-acetyltransferase [Propylenella binzhouense]